VCEQDAWCAIAEFAYMARVTPSADVFSFGIILMELLTRKRPTSIPSSSSASEQKDTTLQEWIENAFKDCKSLDSVVDPLLLQNVSEEQEEKIGSLLNISLMCTKATPENRPSMSQVLPWLLKIKENRMHA
jgi:LRR receptor-like serine/threonine-protein kinase FLS2